MRESTVAGMQDLTTSSHMASEQMIHTTDSMRASVLTTLCRLSCAAASARADVRLPAVLSDRMVLQQDSDVRLYGWAYEGEEVIVETSWGVIARGVSDSRGEWSVTVRTPAALAGVYGLPVGCEGPIFDRMTREGSALRVFFRNTAGGLTATGTSPQNFAIAGSDRKFAWATARIEHDGVVVSSPAILDPVAVR